MRPFNCVGIGERRALRDTDIMSGNVKLALRHVVPDLVLKVLKGQDPLHILGDGNQVRHYTYGGDLAHGIRLAMESPAAVNDDFNLSTAASTTVLELAECHLAQGPRRRPPVPLRHDAPFEHDVQLRVPDVRKAREVLGFEATTTLDDDARRGDPVDPRRGGGRPAVSRLLDDSTRRGSTSARSVPRTPSGGEIVGYLQRYIDASAPVLDVACDRAISSGARSGVRAMGDRHPRRARRLPADVRFVQSSASSCETVRPRTSAPCS